MEYVSATGLQPDTIVTRLKEQLGGRLAHNADSYEKIGANRWSLGVIRKGYRPTWKKRAPVQRVAQRNPSITPTAAQVLDKEVQGLLDKGVIRVVDLVPGQYVSSYFAVPKSKRSPDKWRPILNLKRFNKSIRHVFFKMEDIKTVRKWIQKNAWCAGLDLKDAFLHVPMHSKFRKYLRFKWNKKLYEWQVLPFGLKFSPRILMYMVKPILRFL